MITIIMTFIMNKVLEKFIKAFKTCAALLNRQLLITILLNTVINIEKTVTFNYIYLFFKVLIERLSHN